MPNTSSSSTMTAPTMPSRFSRMKRRSRAPAAPRSLGSGRTFTGSGRAGSRNAYDRSTSRLAPTTATANARFTPETTA